MPVALSGRQTPRLASTRADGEATISMRLAFGSVVTADLASFVGLPAAGPGGHPWQYCRAGLEYSLSSELKLNAERVSGYQYTAISTRCRRGLIGHGQCCRVRAAAQARDTIALSKKRAAARATTIAGTAYSTRPSVPRSLLRSPRTRRRPLRATAVSYVRVGRRTSTLAPYHVRDNGHYDQAAKVTSS